MEMRGIQAAHGLLSSEIETAIRAVFEHGRFIGGPEVAELEDKLAAYAGVPYCATCGNGTDALSLILAAMDIGPGDAVFLPGYTFFATAEAVLAAGAQPVLVDVRACDANMDPLALSAAIEHHTGGTPRAIIGVDLFGQSADWPAITGIAERYGLRVIEDAAQSMGGQLDFARCGSFGDAAAVSFFPSKPLGGIGDGGAVLTHDEDIAGRVRLLKNHGRDGGKYHHIAVGRNSRLDSIPEALLLTKLPHLDAWVGICEAAARRYKKLLPEAVIPLTIADNARSAWAQYVVTLPSEEVRDTVRAELKLRQIPHDIYYPIALSEQPILKNFGASLPVAERLSRATLALPIHPFIALEEQLEVTDAIRLGLSY